MNDMGKPTRATRAIFLLPLLILSFASVLSAQSTCDTEIAFTNAKATPVLPSERLQLNLFSTVSQPSSCLPAEIRLMAAFYDADQNLICSGIIESITVQSANVQSTNIELRPLNMVEFVRLRIPTTPPPKRLFCMNLEGNVEVAQSDIARANSVRVRATILPKNGGVATTEIRFTFSN
jgi:hypothetical protein